jgi:hypothetical protein
VRITRYGSHPSDTEIEPWGIISQLFEERHDKRAQALEVIDVRQRVWGNRSERTQSTCRPKRYFFAKTESASMSSMHPSGKFTAEPTSMIVFALLVKIRLGYERRVRLYIHGSPNMLDVHLAGVWIDGDMVDLDTEVLSGLVKSGMSRCRYDPVGLGQNLEEQMVTHVHLRLGDAFYIASPFTVRLARHED